MNLWKPELSAFGARCEIIRLESGQAAQHVPDGIDFVYIDANHSYGGVYRDLCLWSGKVREGGIIGGHDYGHADFPGVKQAIDEFFGRFAWEIHEEGEGVWWVTKRTLHISFVIPAYNCADTIADAIGSILDHNLEAGDEIIVVNDCSTDQTANVIEELQNTTDCMHVIGHRVNKGTAAAGRNTGVEQAANELIFCLDSDNVLQPGSVSALQRHLFNTGADAAAFGQIRYFTDRTTDTTHRWIYNDEITLADALAGHYWPGPSGNYLFTKGSWRRAGRYYEPSLENQTADSWIFGIRLLGTGSRMVTLPNTWYYHRYGHQSHYVRNSSKGNQSLAAMIGLIPFLELLEERDVEYIFSRAGRYEWYEKLQERPLRVKAHKPGRNGRVLYGASYDGDLKIHPIGARLKKLHSRLKRLGRRVH